MGTEGDGCMSSDSFNRMFHLCYGREISATTRAGNHLQEDGVGRRFLSDLGYDGRNEIVNFCGFLLAPSGDEVACDDLRGEKRG